MRTTRLLLAAAVLLATAFARPNIQGTIAGTGNVGIPYSSTLIVTGAQLPVSWYLVSGSLPEGLTLSSAGVISGTPAQIGLSAFTVEVKDQRNETDRRSFSIVIAPRPPVDITTTSLASGTVGVAYSQSLAASGGASPYSWSLASGTLPPGLSLSSSGSISGTPTSAGTRSFTVRVTDAATGTDTQSLTIAIAPPALVIPASQTPGGTVGAPYAYSLSATGGTPPYSWSLAGGSLPAGLTLSPTGSISGTPTAAGTSNFTVRVTDSAAATTTQGVSITIAPPSLTITANPPAGAVGAAYAHSLSVTGGTPPYSWSLAGGALPAGLTLSPGGSISGTPTTAGTSNFTVRVTDSTAATATQALSITIGSSVVITQCPSPAGVTGQAYSSAGAASGGVAPYSWSVAGGQLPPGLSLAPTGSLSGTPNQAGFFGFTLQAADAQSASGTRACTITVAGAITIATGSLAGGAPGASYSQQLSATGGTPPYAWSVVAGTLPPGIALNAAGLLTGVAISAGTFNFTLRVTDSTGARSDRDFSIAVVSGLAINSCPVPTATTGAAYGSSAAASGGQPPYAWSIASGVLPGGLSLDASSGSIAGTPSIAGNFDFTIRAVDRGGAFANLSCAIRVSAPIAVTTATLPDATLRVAYSAPLTATGGAQPYIWSVAAGALPPGITLQSAGTLAGTPSAAGAFSITLRVEDAVGASAQKQFTITVASGLTIAACPTPLAGSGSTYASDLSAIGGVAPYTWIVSSGVLPPGLSLTGARISGSPNQTGTFGFTLTARDSAGRTTDRSCSIAVGPPLTITTASLASAVLGAPYAQSLTASGGTSPYAWNAPAATLPPGLFLNSGTGQITGTPTSAGSYLFTVTVIDSAGIQQTRSFTLNVGAGLAITSCPAPVAAIGQPYNGLLTAQGGQPPLSFALLSGALPPGFELDGSRGLISGTTSQIGVSSFVVRVSDSAGASGTQACTISVTGGDLFIETPPALAPAAVGVDYSMSFAAKGGAGSYQWTVSAGALPPGLTLDASGALHGAPSAAGVFQFSAQASDAAGNSAVQTFTLSVLVAPVPGFSYNGLPDIVPPANQPVFDLMLDSTYPIPIDGVLTLAFTPDPGIDVDDPAIRLANGNRTVRFAIPANSRRAVFDAPIAALQTGTVAGVIELRASVQTGGADLGTPNGARKTIRVDRLAPRITAATFTQNGLNLEVQVTGFSTTREVTQGTFRFTPADGGAAEEVVVTMSAASALWFRDPASQRFGGQFKLRQPFTLQNNRRYSSVSVTLTNAQGTSAAVNASAP